MIDFPVGATIGQEFYTGTKKYTWDGVKWKVYALTLDWVRPSDWLTIPAVLATEQKFIGLHAVFPNDNLADSSNYVALMCYGNYTVDWGDGVIENFNQAITAYHVYDYNNIPANTYCSRGYRQVLVTVTPQSGLILTNLSLNTRHFRAALNGSAGWLDITISMPQATGYCSIGQSGTLLDYLEQIKILTLGNITSLSTVFAYTRSLVSIPLFDTSKITNVSQMFRENKATKVIPAFDFSSVTDASNFALSATALVTVGAIKTSANLTNATQMFNSCQDLLNVPLFNTGNVTNASGMFASCFCLQRLPEFNFSNVTNVSGMFQNCYALQTIPAFNFNNVTNALNMFQNCINLLAFPAFNFNNVTTGNFNNAFAFCSSVVKSDVTGVKFTHSYNSDKLSPNAITTIMNNLPTVPSAQTISISNNWGVAPTYNATCNTVVGSKAISLISGNLTTIRYPSNNIIEVINGTPSWQLNNRIVFAVSGNAGVLINTPYYIVSILTAVYFKISLTLNGTPITFTAGGTDGQCVWLPLDSQVTGLGSPLTTPIAIAFTGSKVVLTTHQLLANDIVSFPTITTTTGLTSNTPYYITGTVNSGDFQIAANTGGTPLTFSDGTGTMLYDSIIESISGAGYPFTINMTRPMTATTVANTMAFRTLKTSIALFKNWIVSG